MRNQVSHEERLRRIVCHKLHTICLTANAMARNRWLNDDLLQARLLSLTPLDVQMSFSAITKARYPNAGERGHRFEKALTKLVEWWSGVFFQAEPEGHIRNRTYEAVTTRMDVPDYRGKLRQDLETDALVELLEDILDDEGEIIRAPKSLMKHALMQSGCRDTGAQLFTALCRALDLPTRLIASIQSVPWKVNVDKPKAPSKPKKKTDSDVDSVQSEATSHKPTIKLRKTPHKGHILGKKPKIPPPKRKEDALYMPPVFWTEVYSRADGRWIPIDPLRAITNNRKVFDPTGASTENRMVYVLAFEEDGYVRDITRKYAREFSAKAGKLRKG
ncbi:Rad4-domain-containing protein, partial [Cylindrobasidium torrendii FP15055 ss-10]